MGESQSKKEAWIESITSTAIGYVTAVIIQLLIFPLFDVHASILSTMGIVIIFTVISVVRNFYVREAFNRYDQFCEKRRMMKINF